jgi:hypothetical protein
MRPCIDLSAQREPAAPKQGLGQNRFREAEHFPAANECFEARSDPGTNPARRRRQWSLPERRADCIKISKAPRAACVRSSGLSRLEQQCAPGHTSRAGRRSYLSAPRFRP